MVIMIDTEAMLPKEMEPLQAGPCQELAGWAHNGKREEDPPPVLWIEVKNVNEIQVSSFIL